MRIGNIVQYYAAGAALATDVVEFEPGLARIALARWGSALQFHRVYRALDVLQQVFDASALPDVGLVAERVGMEKCVALAESGEGRTFREWFWRAAEEVLADTGTLDEQVASRLERMVGLHSPLPRDLLIAMANDGSPEGLAARLGGDESLQRQRQFSAERFRRLILQKDIELPSPDGPCICGSGSPFATCCGRILL